MKESVSSTGFRMQVAHNFTFDTQTAAPIQDSSSKASTNNQNTENEYFFVKTINLS